MKLKEDIQISLKDNPILDEMEALLEFFTSSEKNLTKTHFELANEYPNTNADIWRQFLTLKPVVNYIEENIQLMTAANVRNLQTSKTARVSEVQKLNTLKQITKDEGKQKERPKIIVMSDALFSRYQED